MRKEKKHTKLNDLEKTYKEKQLMWKTKIRLDSNKFRRFWKWVCYLIAFPFVWLFYNIRDWRTFVIFVIVFLVVSCEVWVPYLIAFICWNNETLRYSMLGVGSACWLFWAGPGTPFIIICISLTIGIKSVFNKIKQKRIVKKIEKTNSEKCPYEIEKD